MLDFVSIYPSLRGIQQYIQQLSLFLPVTRDGCHKTGSVSPVQRRECDMCARKANIISTVIKLLLLNAAGVKRYLQMDIRASVGERFWRIMALSSFLSLSLSTSLCESVSCGVSNTQDSWRMRKKEQGADDFSLRSISGCIVRRAAFLLFLSILAAAYLSSTDNWTSQVINEPLALKGLMRARAPLFKQPSRATPTFRLRNYGYWVCANCCQLSCRRAAASATREEEWCAASVCMVISNPFIYVKRNGPRRPFVVHLVIYSIHINMHCSKPEQSSLGWAH